MVVYRYKHTCNWHFSASNDLIWLSEWHLARYDVKFNAEWLWSFRFAKRECDNPCGFLCGCRLLYKLELNKSWNVRRDTALLHTGDSISLVRHLLDIQQQSVSTPTSSHLSTCLFPNFTINRRHCICSGHSSEVEYRWKGAESDKKESNYFISWRPVLEIRRFYRVFWKSNENHAIKPFDSHTRYLIFRVNISLWDF